MGAPIVDRNLARDDPTTPSRASRTSKRAASTWTNRRVHRPADAPSTGSRRLRRATAPSFHSEPPTPHPRLTRPRPSPATVPQASEAAGEPTTRVGRVKLNLRHIMHRHATGTKRARGVTVPRPRHHDSRHGDATDIRAAHRRLRARRAGGGFEARRRRRRRLERADDDNWRRRRREASAGDALGARGEVLLDVPPADERRTSLEGVSFARWFARGGWGSGAENGSETVRRTPATATAHETRGRGAANRASDPRVADKIGLRDGDGVRSFDKDTTSPHHNTSHSLVSPAHLVFLKRLGATHLSTHPHMSKYCPVQCASPVVSFSTRATHASYAAMNFAHLGLHASSRSGL